MNMDRKITEIVDNIRRVSQAVKEQSKLAERQKGMTEPQLLAVKIIAANAPINGAELARRMYLHRATVFGIIDRLAERNLVIKTRSKADRRGLELELTEKGNALLSGDAAQGPLSSDLQNLHLEKLLRIKDGLEELVKVLA